MAERRTAASEASLEIRVLGPLAVGVDGRPLVVDTRKALAILAMLVVDGRTFARDELAALLWPDSDDESARGALRRTLSVLRAGLGGRWLAVDRSSVSLDRHGVWTDLGMLEAALVSSDIDTLRSAVEATRGPLLAGFSLRDSVEFDDWRAARSSAVERTVGTVLDRLAAIAAAGGNVATAIDAGSRRIELDPLDEPARRRLMAALASSGDRAGAIRQYRDCVATLERELGVRPLQETTELYERIRDARVEIAPEQPLPAPAPPPLGLPLVGRDADRRALVDAHLAAARHGGVATVAGEAGIGKTRLVDALDADVAGRGGTVLRGRAYAAEANIPYAPIVALLRAAATRPVTADRLARLSVRVRHELDRLVALSPTPSARSGGLETGDDGPPAATDDPAAARLRLLDALASTLADVIEGRTAGLVVVEDVQWLDDASRDVLAYLSRRLDERRVLMVLTWRPEDLDDRALSFVRRLDDLPARPAVLLRPLSPTDVATLVAAYPTTGSVFDVKAIVDESEGIPLYVIEALAAGTDRPPGRWSHPVQALLRDRLASVGDAAGQVLAAASVIGRSFDLAAVRATSGRAEEEVIGAVEELVRRGIVREFEKNPDVTFDFAHAKLRDAAYDGTSLARRRLLHRRTADWLRSLPAAAADGIRLSQIARHERAAGREIEAAAAFREAGIQARTVFANREALGHLETALALGYPDSVGLGTMIGELRTSTGDYAGAAAILEAAASTASPADLPGIELRLGRVHARRGDLVTATSHLDAVIAGLTAHDPPAGADAAAGSLAGPPEEDRAALLARALVERGVVAHRAGRAGAARQDGHSALVIADRSGDAAAAGAAHRLLGLAAREAGDLDAARDELQRSVVLATADPDPSTAVAVGNALALVEAASGDVSAAITRLEGLVDACERAGLRHFQAAVENNLADQLHAAGRGDEAMDHLKLAVALFADVGGGPGELEPEIWKLVDW